MGTFVITRVEGDARQAVVDRMATDMIMFCDISHATRSAIAQIKFEGPRASFEPGDTLVVLVFRAKDEEG